MAVRKRGDRWVVRWREGGRGSPAHQKTFTREKDARRFDTAIRRARDLGQLASEVVGSKQTVASFLDEWWEKYARASLKPSTRASYAYVLDRWIVPYLGRLRLRDVSREMIDEYRAELVAAGAGTPTIRIATARLFKACSDERSSGDGCRQTLSRGPFVSRTSVTRRSTRVRPSKSKRSASRSSRTQVAIVPVVSMPLS
jgi:Phage integrase, N-terminal SAM-like domain